MVYIVSSRISEVSVSYNTKCGPHEIFSSPTVTKKAFTCHGTFQRRRFAALYLCEQAHRFFKSQKSTISFLTLMPLRI